MDALLPLLVFGPMAGGVGGYLIGRKSKSGRNLFDLAVTALVFALTVAFFVRAMGGEPPSFSVEGFGGLQLTLKADGFRTLYGVITAFMWLMTTLFAQEYFAHSHKRNRYWLFNLLTLGATMGVFLSADLYTTFLFFEVMSFTSYVMVAHDDSAPAMRVAGTYLAVAVIGGLVMLMGIFILYSLTGTLRHDALLEASAPFRGDRRLYLAATLMLVGFGAKAGMFPFHIWLPKAHPIAPAPASALLSGVLTKSGVFGVLLIGGELMLHDEIWGRAILIFGLITMLLGAVLALLSIDLKRSFACSSVSQIGFILVGAGMQGLLGSHNALAVRGTLLHMVNHSLIKLVLFMAAGVVHMNLHKLDLNEIRGYGRGKPLLFFAFSMGALSIMGVPLWSGYISKTLLHESIVEYIWTFSAYTPMARLAQGAEYLFVFTGGLTAAYMIKLLVALFLDKPKSPVAKGRYICKKSAAALAISAAVLPVLGSWPAIMDKIANIGQSFVHGHAPDHAVHYFSGVNLKGGLASLAIGAAVYLFVVRGVTMDKDAEGNAIYRNLWPTGLDLEELVYRPVLGGLTTLFSFLMGLVDRAVEPPVKALLAFSAFLMRRADRVVEQVVKASIAAGAFLMRGADRIVEIAVRASIAAGAFLMRCVDRVAEPLVVGFVVAGTFLTRVCDTVVDAAAHYLLGCPLRAQKAKPFPGRFYEKYYWLIFPRKEAAREKAALSESFSYGLLLFGAGLCAALLFVLYHAFR